MVAAPPSTGYMKRSHLASCVFAAIVVLAAALRFPALDLRPMHADEAVHAAKMARLLEQGRYEYDPEEYHGPTLNYLTSVPARLQGAVRYADLDEATLRSVPAATGVLLVAAHVLLVPLIGLPAAALSALFTAVSPAMVYYSRYYIQETLLVCFSFFALISICRYLRAPHWGWAVGAGLSAGLMAATKETWVIAGASMAAALSLVLVFGRPRATLHPPPGGRWQLRHLVAAALVAAAVSALFFSSFLSNPRGIIDSVLSYRTYVERAAGASSWHVYPWHFYFGLLLFFHLDGGPVWTEALIVGLALVGLVAAAARVAVPGVDRRTLGLLSIYTVAITAFYAAIPYKTPWCLLGFLHGLALLAGVGAAYIFGTARSTAARAAVVVLLAAGTAHLGWQAWAGSFRYGADPRNPYVYAHTSTDVFKIARRIEELAQVHPQHQGMPIEVISRQNLWPLPWYLRRFSAVQWATGVVDTGTVAPVILTTPDMEGEVVRKLYELRPPGQRELYVDIFDAPVELRPQVELRGYAAKSLWDSFRQAER